MRLEDLLNKGAKPVPIRENHEKKIIQRFIQNPPQMLDELECMKEVKTNAGYIDILCKNKKGLYWIIEAKTKMNKTGIGQLFAYRYCFMQERNIPIDRIKLALLYNVEDTALTPVYLSLGIYLIEDNFLGNELRMIGTAILDKTTSDTTE